MSECDCSLGHEINVVFQQLYKMKLEKKPALTRMQTSTPALFLFLVNFTFDFLTPK